MGALLGILLGLGLHKRALASKTDINTTIALLIVIIAFFNNFSSLFSF